MSALADYYAAAANEKNATVGLLGQQTRAAAANVDTIAGDADARQAAQFGQANLSNAQAGVTAGDAGARQADQFAAANLAGTQANAIRAKTPGDIADTQANTALTRQRTDLLGPESASALATAGLQRGQLQFGLQNIDPDVAALLAKLYPRGGAEKGTSKIKPLTSKAANPNGSPGKTDSVPMMLAPGEAVLNKGAVNHYGTDVIGHMNKMGLMHTKAHKEVSALVKKHMGMAGQKRASRKKAA